LKIFLGTVDITVISKK